MLKAGDVDRSPVEFSPCKRLIVSTARVLIEEYECFRGLLMNEHWSNRRKQLLHDETNNKKTKAIIGNIDLSGRGLEIAPYFRPTISKDDYNINYVDYVDNETIRIKSESYDRDVIVEIPEIDWVWLPSKSLREIVPASVEFDYAIASHVIEHVPDVIGWLNEILSVLKPGANSGARDRE